MPELHLNIDGRERRTIVHLPRAAGPLPVILLLHGAGGTPEWMLHETRMHDLADAEGILLAAPEATRPDPHLPARFYTNPPVWNDGSDRPPVDRVRAVDDVAFIRALLDELPRHYPIDPKRVFATGFSNGAGMTFRLGLELADRLAAIAPVAGHLSVSSPPTPRPMPTFYLIGRADPLVPEFGGQVKTPWAKSQRKPPVRYTLARWAALHGLPPLSSTIEDNGIIRRERWRDGLLEAWFIAGLGHHWPGGRAGLNRRLAGPPSDAVDATRAIWSFFQASVEP
jgi:polyhydroxybutyrate depolymerase